MARGGARYPGISSSLSAWAPSWITSSSVWPPSQAAWGLFPPHPPARHYPPRLLQSIYHLCLMVCLHCVVSRGMDSEGTVDPDTEALLGHLEQCQALWRCRANHGYTGTQSAPHSAISYSPHVSSSQRELMRCEHVQWRPRTPPGSAAGPWIVVTLVFNLMKNLGRAEPCKMTLSALTHTHSYMCVYICIYVCMYIDTQITGVILYVCIYVIQDVCMFYTVKVINEQTVLVRV